MNGISDADLIAVEYLLCEEFTAHLILKCFYHSVVYCIAGTDEEHSTFICCEGVNEGGVVELKGDDVSQFFHNFVVI